METETRSIKGDSQMKRQAEENIPGREQRSEGERTLDALEE